MNFTDANLKIILDSRGEETLEAELKADKFSALASVPSGKSKGAHEAFVLEPKKAIEKFGSIKPEFLSHEFKTQEEFDNFLISLDGTPDKKNLGGNLMLALSLAFARLKAKIENLELFQYISQVSGIKHQALKSPLLIFNMIEGGVHAKSSLNFQEFQIIPDVKDFGIALGLGQEFYRKLKEFLEKKFGKENISLGDESGFSALFKTNEEALEILFELIQKYNYPLRIGLDAAANQFYMPAEDLSKEGKKDFYLIDGKKYSAEELKNYYLEIIKRYNILSIEDPFNEESFSDFSELNREIKEFPHGEAIKCLVITDDLTTTNPERLKIAINKKSGNMVLIKPNQIGTLTETLNVVKLAYENNWQAAVSHRSGETMDNFIADLAMGIGAWGIKAGAPIMPERLVKYERILEIINYKSING